MTDVEPWGAAQRLSPKADGATSANTYKKKANKIPQDTMKRGANTNRTGQLSRRNAGGFSRRLRHTWNAMMPAMMERLGADVEVQLRECSPSDEDKLRVERCFGELQATLAQLGPRWNLEVFGSVASGFSTCNSDMDATCVRCASEEGAEEKEEEQPEAKTILLERLSPLFRDKSDFSVIEEIPSAKVPILRLRFEGHLDVDLSCQNTMALRNTRLLRAYADLDPRIRDLGVAVKLWAKVAAVCGAAQSKLSSYTFTLLTIYFMQVHRDVNLPCLSPGLFEDSANPETRDSALANARSSWSCPLSLPDLLFRFFGFYAMDFDWGREVASTRIGQRRHSRDGVFEKLRGRHRNGIHIEDPYHLERNLHCVLGEPEETELREAFQMAWYTLYDGGTPVGLHPEVPAEFLSGQKMELQLSELTGSADNFSPQSSPDFGPAANPAVWRHMMGAGDAAAGYEVEAVVHEATVEGSTPKVKAQTSDPMLSSSGSTESGDAGAPHGSASSSGESRCSDDESAAFRFVSLEELENQMVHKQDIAAIARSSPAVHGSAVIGKVMSSFSPMGSPSGPRPAPEPAGQWWLKLGSAAVIEAVERGNAQEKKNSSILTVQDLERQMTGERPDESSQPGYPSVGIYPLLGRSFSASATSKIANRITSKCFGRAAQVA